MCSGEPSHLWPACRLASASGGVVLAPAAHGWQQCKRGGWRLACPPIDVPWWQMTTCLWGEKIPLWKRRRFCTPPKKDRNWKNDDILRICIFIEWTLTGATKKLGIGYIYYSQTSRLPNHHQPIGKKRKKQKIDLIYFLVFLISGKISH